MDVVGLNRVELVIDQARIHDAVKQFNEAFGLRLPDPIDIAGHGALSATDFAGGLEFIAPAPGDTSSSVGRRLAEFGEGQLGPLVFRIRDVEAARGWLESRGFRIRYEYDSRQGSADEVEMSVHQLHLDPEQWFGFNVTLMRPFEGGAAATAVAQAADGGAATRERNKAAVLAFAAALGAGDIDALAELLAPDFSWEVPVAAAPVSSRLAGIGAPSGEPRDRATTLAVLDATLEATVGRSLRLDVGTMTAEDDRVAATATGHAVIAATGRTYANRYHQLFTFDGEGLIRRFVEYQDTLHTVDVWVAG
ncbi:nuclear transport factor 2 family protein [Trujillonella endophytica]|uniref:Ketosteroid isomerase-related protein n=1 Tax=Trujillonella endophytica TaxID=673521 RepID=A0A1H8VVN0_9ACTN|nr:nuclear transport factor 2 family protein [Trujillella endophytica]SEP19384.1 Ketosteroid isomerase-related protein [Trujillella endophytica]